MAGIGRSVGVPGKTQLDFVSSSSPSVLGSSVLSSFQDMGNCAKRVWMSLVQTPGGQTIVFGALNMRGSRVSHPNLAGILAFGLAQVTLAGQTVWGNKAL